MDKKQLLTATLFIIALVLIGVIGCSLVALNNITYPTFFPIVKKPQETSRPITIEGEVVCLPHKPDGLETFECTYGLKGDDGKYYGLTNLNQDDLVSGRITIGLHVRVSGILRPDPGSQYDIVGTIEVETIE